ncbi:hypothetical protein [Marinicrinis sediminis]|uniref:Uncharacterized protein n=1 Tax=Marinicrinis sediminis TaxID=1652465 RepID=A0ABW5R7F8_9BACL
MKKRVIAILSLLLVLIMLPTAVFAEGKAEPNEAALDAYLRTAGYPGDVISSFEVEQKISLFNRKAVYLYHKSEVGSLLAEMPPAESEPGAGGITTLRSDDVNMDFFDSTLVASQVADPYSTIARVQFDYNWDWDLTNYNGRYHELNYHDVDKFGIAWSDGWDPEPESAVYSYRYYGSNGSIYRNESIGMINDYDSFDQGEGIGWEIELVESFSDHQRSYGTYRHKGWGQVTAVIDHDGSGGTGSSSAVGTYFHHHIGANEGTLQYQGGAVPTVGITYSWQYSQSDGSAGEQWFWTKN